MQLKLEPASPIPMYLQIIEQVRYAIAAGMLAPHEELPSVRALALEQLINPNTVARAYLELEREGLVAKRRGAGTYVSGNAQSMGDEFRLKTVRDLVEKAVATARELRVSPRKVRALLDEQLKHHLMEQSL